jgi:uncharacterized LabA/DUF88 family protein
VSDVIAYIDGFNLYYGLRDTYRRRFLWLDLESLCASLLLPSQSLVAVKYFTAPVRGRPDSLRRQQAYWNALEAHCKHITIQLGRFQQRRLDCRACGAVWTSYEEKETDVGIAVELIRDVAFDACDTAILVSADGDLCPAIREAYRMHSPTRVVVAFPPGRRSDDLREFADHAFTIGRGRLQRALLPDRITLPDGSIVVRPERWR